MPAPQASADQKSAKLPKPFVKAKEKKQVAIGIKTNPADKVVQRSVASLVPYARNARTHSPQQIDQIAASIKQWGWTVPVLVDEKGMIIAGHGRILAAQKLGIKQVPVMVADGWTEPQKAAYVIADNKLAMNAGWDDKMLGLELLDLKGLGFDLSLTGFDGFEIDKLIGGFGQTDPDDAPPVPATPVTRLGDVWLLGRHRLTCGDSTEAATVELALAGAKPHLMVTDPPYGVSYDADWRREAGLVGKGAAVGKVLNDERADWRAAWTLFPGGIAYVWHGGLHTGEVVSSLKACKFQIRSQIIWVKTRPVISRGHYHWQHEPALYGVREGEEENWNFVPEHEVAAYSIKDGSTGEWQGGRKQSTVWFIEHLKSDTGHSTQKPVECMKRPIENNSKPGDAVYEPFSGSGTTIMAGEITGRSVYAVELSPAYVDVAVERWQNFTGKQAKLESTGKAFAQTGQRDAA